MGLLVLVRRQPNRLPVPENHSPDQRQQDGEVLPMETAKKIEHPVDRVMEPVMASLIGCSPKSLEHQRYQGLIPPWVWAKENGRIYYYISRYNEWAESRAPCRPVLKSSKGSTSASGSLGTPDAARRLHIPRQRKGSPRPIVSELR